MSEEKLTKLIKKMINVIKPNGVLDIEFRLVPLGIRDDEFYMETTYRIEIMKNKISSKRVQWLCVTKQLLCQLFFSFSLP